MLRKSTVIVSSTGEIPNLWTCCNAPSCASQSSPRWKLSASTHQTTARGYATVSDKQTGSRETHVWPKPRAPGAPLTPYEILNLKRGSPYSKKRFYELVKVYHPDRNGHYEPLDELPAAVKLERYRLIVAANDILSDPVKRGAYDSYGAGWNGMPEVRGARNSTAQAWEWGDKNKDWDGPTGPSRNATWEDWERWYNKDEAKQEPVYISNRNFVLLVALAAGLGSYGQTVRMDNYSSNLIDRVEARHAETSKQLMRTRQLTYAEDGSSDERKQQRIEKFLKNRDAGNYGLWIEPDAGGDKLPADDSTCGASMDAKSSKR